MWKWLLGLGLVVLLAVVALMNNGGPQESAAYAKRERIDQACDQMMSDSALGIERRQTREVCERMKLQAKEEYDAARRAKQ